MGLCIASKTALGLLPLAEATLKRNKMEVYILEATIQLLRMQLPTSNTFIEIVSSSCCSLSRY